MRVRARKEEDDFNGRSCKGSLVRNSSEAALRSVLQEKAWQHMVTAGLLAEDLGLTCD